MQDSKRNLFTAIFLSLLILVGFHFLYEKPQMEKQRAAYLAMKQEEDARKAAQGQNGTMSGAAAEMPVSAGAVAQERERATVIAEGFALKQRLPIVTPALQGSINLKGGRIDDVSLTQYHETLEPNAPKIVLLSPSGSAAPHKAYYAEFGWLGKGVGVPSPDTVWQSDEVELAPGKPVTLRWENGQGLTFERAISVDEKFMFTVTDKVKNQGGTEVTLYPYGLISRHGKPHTTDIYILHEGPIGVLAGTITDPKYATLAEEGSIKSDSQGGWVGLTDKYWLAALVPPQSELVNAGFSFDKAGQAKPEDGIYQSDYRGTSVVVAAGSAAEHSQQFFAGAKELRTLNHYQAAFKISHFSDAIDFGWYWFLTKPFLFLLDVFGAWFGNFGLAILAFTVLLKLLTLPLSLKSYRSMARMREIQPRIKELMEKYKDDRQKLGVEQMQLYKQEKVNPLSGCLPQLIQIPIFFALYKILYVGIELRHAPFYGWIHDLSAPDPTSVLTLFGLLNYSFIPHIGVWPILMGISMFMTQRLSPQPPDKTQAQIFMFLPLIFTFMLAGMASGLIIYWTWSNLLGLAQQWYIMHHTGALKKAKAG